MKVLVFTALYPNNVRPNHGVFIKERMTHFAKLDGCEAKVVAPVPYFPAVNLNWRWQFSQVTPLEVRDGLEVYHPRYWMTPKVGMSLYGLMMFLSVLSTVRRIRKKFDFDLIDAHFVYPDGFAAVLLGWVFKKPVVVSARGSDINSYQAFPIIRKLLQYTLNRADRVIAVSQALKQTMGKLGVREDCIDVVPNGVSLDKFRPIPKKEARQLLDLPMHRKIVLSVGHLTSNKGFDLVIRSIQILLEDFHEVNPYLVIVGDGVVGPELRKLVALLKLHDLVLLAGAIPHEELYRWYSAADLFCLASKQEGWPNVLLESLACGTPVIATSAGGIPEVISSDQIGVLTEREEAKIARGIYRALRKTWRTVDLVEHAKHYTWKRTALNLRHVFESVINCKPDRFHGARHSQPDDAPRDCCLPGGEGDIKESGRVRKLSI